MVDAPQLNWVKTDFLDGLAPIWFVYAKISEVQPICLRVEYELQQGKWIVDVCNTVRHYKDGFLNEEIEVKIFAEQKLQEFLISVKKLLRKKILSK